MAHVVNYASLLTVQPKASRNEIKGSADVANRLSLRWFLYYIQGQSSHVPPQLCRMNSSIPTSSPPVMLYMLILILKLFYVV